MNFKIKKALVLIFIVISLLLVVNSVNATDTYENNTIVDDSLSLANDASIENLNNEISDDVITINSDDGTETEVTNSVAEVSNSNGKLGSTDDSDVLSDHIQNGRFYINVVSDTPVVKPGDEVIFDVYVKNTGPEYGGVFDYEAWNNVLTINNWFDKNQFDLLWVEPTDNWDSNYFKINELKIVEAYGSSYVPIRYKVWGWKNGYDLHYKVHLKAKNSIVPGNYEFKAQIYDNTWPYTGGANDESTANVMVGVASLNITKTAVTPVVMKGERVCFEIYVKNNGSLPVIDDYIYINDWFDYGLIYDGYEIMPNDDGIIYDKNYDISTTFDGYGYRVVARYATQNDWKPDYNLRFRLYFNTTDVGEFNNMAHIFWKWKSWGGPDVHEHIEVRDNASVIVAEPEFTVNKTASSSVVNVGDMVSYNVTVNNTGLVNLTGIFIQDKDYSNGLRYLDYSDKDLWEYDGVDKWTLKGVLAPGESTSLILTFEVTKAGLLINNVIAGNGLKNETKSSEADVEVLEEENETNKNSTAPDDPKDDGPEGSDYGSDESQNDGSDDGSDEADNVSGETQDKNEVHAETSKSVMNATGNPLLVLLISLMTLGFVPLRRKK